MNRAGLTAFSIASLAAVTYAVAQAPAGKPVATTAKVPTELPTAPAAKPVEHRALAIQVTAPEVKPVETAAIASEVAAPVVEADKKIEAAAVAPTPAAPPAPPPITLMAKVDLTTQRLTVVENGVAKFTWMISSGAKGYDTPRGMFQPQWMAKDWYSRKYDNAPMPHSVFFKDGAAIHATMNPGSLGTAASHGCVRLSKPNAAVFYAMVRRHSMAQTRIHVFGSPRHSPDLVASRQPSRSIGQAPVQQRITAATKPVFAQPSMGRYNGHGYYNSNGSAFAPRANAPRPLPVYVVQSGHRGVRY